MHSHLPTLSFIIFIALFLAGCSSKNNTPQDHLGEIHFVVIGKEEAQPAFTKGMLLSIVLNMRMQQKHFFRQDRSTRIS